MRIEILRPGIPPEPIRFARRLSRLAPEPNAIALANAVPDIFRVKDGEFDQTRDLGPLTVHVMQRELLCRVGSPPAPTPRDAKKRDLRYFLRQFLAMRTLLPALAKNPREDAVTRVTRIFWFSALEQEMLNANAKYDMARAWVMYEQVWPDLVNSNLVTIRPGLVPTALGAVHNALLFLLSVSRARGHIPDPARYFSTTSLRLGLPDLLRQCATPIAELRPVLETARLPDNALRNVFMEHPLVLLGDGSLLAPDPSILLKSFERSLLLRLIREFIADDGQEGFDDISGAFGLVFEEYGRRVIQSASHLGGQYLSEFKYDRPQVASPDAFVLGAQSLVFEFKATRYPYDLAALRTDPVGHLWLWVSKLLGATATRAELEQGKSFFVRAGQLPEVAGHDLTQALYLICTYPMVPPMLNQRGWRNAALAGRPVLAEPLFARTAFVSISDIETAATAASIAGNPTFSELVLSWWNDVYNGRTANEFCSLRDHILQRYPLVASAELALLASARASLFAAAETAAWGNPHDMPKNWWLTRNEAG